MPLIPSCIQRATNNPELNGESFPLDLQAPPGARAVARGRALGAVGGKPSRMRGAAAAAPYLDAPRGGGGVGGKAPHALDLMLS